MVSVEERERIQRAYFIEGRVTEGKPQREATALRVLGQVYTEMKRWTEARESFRESQQILKEIGEQYELGKTKYQLGLMYVKKGNLPTAKKHLSQARTAFQSVGATKDLEKAQEQLSQLEG